MFPLLYFKIKSPTEYPATVKDEIFIGDQISFISRIEHISTILNSWNFNQNTWYIFNKNFGTHVVASKNNKSSQNPLCKNTMKSDLH